jgi:hypothetical protein
MAGVKPNIGTNEGLQRAATKLKYGVCDSRNKWQFP